MKTTTVGEIFGAIGVLLLLSAPYTYFLTSGSGLFAVAKVAMAIILIAFFFATNYGQLGQLGSKKSSFFVSSTAAIVVLLLAALVAINYIASRKNKSWDLTNKKIYTLAPQTASTLSGLKEKVTAIGFLPTSNPAYESLENLFSRYHQQAPNKFEYVFKDPRKSPDLAAKYQLKEGQTTVVLTKGEGDKETHTALNIVSEQELTNALIKLNSVGEQKVYLVQGHGEWPLELTGVSKEEEGASLSEFKKGLQQEGYAPEALNLAGKQEVPRDASLIVIAGAKSKFAPPEVAVLKKYLEEGGRMLFFAEANAEAGLDKLLAEYGVQIDKGLVADDHFAVESPYVILSLFYSDHEMARILKQMQMNVQFPTTRGLTALREGTASGVHAEAVVLTSPYAWEVEKPTENPAPPSSGAKVGQIGLVVASTRPVQSTDKKRFDEARLVVFGDSELLIDVNWGYEPNRNLVMNALAWASAQVSKITIRPPDRDISTLDIDRVLMAKIRFFATDLLPLALLGAGLVIWRVRRNK